MVVMEAGWGQGPRGGSHKASQEGPGLCAGTKSNVSQEGVRAEYIKVRERVQIWIEHLGASEQTRKESLFLIRGLEFLLKIVVWCMCPLRHPRTGSKRDKVQMSSLSHLSLGELGSLVIEMTRASGLGFDLSGHSHLVLS